MTQMREHPYTEQAKPRFRWVHFLVDVLLLNFAFQIAFFLRFGFAMFTGNLEETLAPVSVYPLFEAVMTLSWISLAMTLRLYSFNGKRRKGRDISIVLRSLVLLGVITLLFIVARGGYNFQSRLFLFYFFGLATLFLVTSHAVKASGGWFRPETRDILIIGAGRAGERFFRNVEKDKGLGYRVIGFLDDNGVDSNVRPMILGKLEDIADIVGKQKIDEVIIALPKTSEQALARLVETCENKFIRVNVIPNDYAALEGKRVVEQVGEFSLVRMREAPLDESWNKALKRIFDIVFGGFIMLIIFPPVYLICGLLIKLSSRGPIFFKQLRTGEDGRNFTCFKFRTMRHQPREDSDSLQALPDDPRLTAIGRFLRRTNLDELPQFWNVLKGDMSVVGPRPHMLKHTEDYKLLINNYMLRHFVKPGVTGWAQVNGLRGATEIAEKMDARVRFDIFYIDNWTFAFDLYIIWLTLVSMIRGDKNAY
jgi:putative colanic acid biosynthesis UDP-glucose lipid carrier transferase